MFGAEIVVAEGPPIRLGWCWARERHFKVGMERVLIVCDETFHGCGGYGMNAGATNTASGWSRANRLDGGMSRSEMPGSRRNTMRPDPKPRNQYSGKVKAKRSVIS